MSAAKSRIAKASANEPRAKEIARPSIASPITVVASLGAVSERAAEAAADRVGVKLVVRAGAPLLDAREDMTLVHALRVEALVLLDGPIGVDEALSVRARRAVADLARGPATSEFSIHEDADGRLSLRAPTIAPVDLGEPLEAREALLDARARGGSTAFPAPEPEIPEDAVERARAIVFGPSRVLSESSSLRLLEAFAVPTSPWRLADDAARAAAAARAIGHPVDLRIASPEASAIDDPLLGAVELRTPAEVRDAFRAVTRELRRGHPHARLLGVVVTRHLAGLPRLRISLDVSSAPMLSIGLDDPIGRKLVPPLVDSPPHSMDAAAALIRRFGGEKVLPARGSTQERALLDLLVRVTRITAMLEGSIERVALAPVSATPEGELRVVGARVHVRGVAVAQDGDGESARAQAP